eukprot:1138339-Pelagomonas_calceolata.AAC.16
MKQNIWGKDETHRPLSRHQHHSLTQTGAPPPSLAPPLPAVQYTGKDLRAKMCNQFNTHADSSASTPSFAPPLPEAQSARSKDEQARLCSSSICMQTTALPPFLAPPLPAIQHATYFYFHSAEQTTGEQMQHLHIRLLSVYRWCMHVHTRGGEVSKRKWLHLVEKQKVPTCLAAEVDVWKILLGRPCPATKLGAWAHPS